MFDNYVVAKTRPLPKWVGPLVGFSVAVHLIVILAFVAQSFWAISKLAVPEAGVKVAVAPPPPPPPPPAAKRKKKKKKVDKVRKPRPKETTQPVKIEDPSEVDDDYVPDDSEDFGVEGGVEGGVAGGVPGGIPGGVPGGPPPPPPAPKVEDIAPKIVPQVALEQQRLSGEKHIVPSDEVKLQIKREGKTRVVTTVKMCLSSGGVVNKLTMLKSSGYPTYDQAIKATMRSWRYRPFMVNGKPVPVCTSVTFIYNQKN